MERTNISKPSLIKIMRPWARPLSWALKQKRCKALQGVKEKWPRRNFGMRGDLPLPENTKVFSQESASTLWLNLSTASSSLSAEAHRLRNRIFFILFDKWSVSNFLHVIRWSEVTHKGKIWCFLCEPGYILLKTDNQLPCARALGDVLERQFGCVNSIVWVRHSKINQPHELESSLRANLASIWTYAVCVLDVIWKSNRSSVQSCPKLSYHGIYAHCHKRSFKMRAKRMKGKSKWQLSLTTSLLCELQKQVKVVQVLENTMRMSEESEECKIDRLGADQSNRCLDPTALRRSVGKHVCKHPIYVTFWSQPSSTYPMLQLQSCRQL